MLLCAGPIARRIDVSPGDVLRAAHDSGVRQFWCCEELFTAWPDLSLHRRQHGGYDAEIEFAASSDIVSLLAEKLGVDTEEIR